MAEILNGKKLAKKVREEVKAEVDKLKLQGINPKLAVIMVGNDSASAVYVKNKSNACKDTGIEFQEFLLPEETTEQEVLELINKLNLDDSIHGILLQSPVPKHINIDKAFDTISPDKDVDGFNAVNVGRLTIGKDCFISCTPYGIMRILEEYNIDVKGKRAVVIGRSNIVGKPMLQCLLSKDATVTICHSKTQNLSEVVKEADIVVAAIGKPNFITGNMIKDGAVVIDVGINRMEDGKLCGDVNFEEASSKASYITPVPGGVGPMTVAMLVENVVKAAKNSEKII